MDSKQQKAGATDNAFTAAGLRQAVAAVERQWLGDPSPLRRALSAHFSNYTGLLEPRNREGEES